MRRLLILGTGPYAEEMAELAAEGGAYQPAGFVENLDRARCADRLAGLPIHWVDDLAKLAADHWAICSLGTTFRDGFIAHAARLGMRFATIVHPSAHVSPSCTLGDGVFIGVSVVVGARTTLGPHVRVNRGVLIGHHTTVSAFSTLQPGANVAGCCRIGEGVYVGMGAVVIDRVTVGAHSVVGAGAVVTDDVPAHVQVVGVPARVVKTDIAGK